MIIWVPNIFVEVAKEGDKDDGCDYYAPGYRSETKAMAKHPNTIIEPVEVAEYKPEDN